MSTLKTDNISPNGSTVNVTSGLNVQGGATLAAAKITGNLDVDGNVFGVNATTNTVTVSSPANTTPVLLLGVSANAGTTHRSIFRFGHDQNSSSIPVGEIHGVVDNTAGASQRAGHIEFSTANAGVTAERMRIESTGKIVVNNARGDVGAGTVLTGQNALGTIHFVQNTTNDNWVGMTTSATSTPTTSQGGILIQGSGGYGTKIHFLTTDAYSAGQKNRMTIDHVGQVGIGTAVPQVPLDVRGGSVRVDPSGCFDQSVAFSSDTGAWARGLHFVDSTATGNFTGITAGFGLYGSASSPRHLYLGHGAGPYNDGGGLYVYKDNNVGIGTHTPTVKLDVNGGVKAASVSVTNTTASTSTSTGALVVTGGVGVGGGVNVGGGLTVGNFAVANVMPKPQTSSSTSVGYYTTISSVSTVITLPSSPAGGKWMWFAYKTGGVVNSGLSGIGTSGEAVWDFDAGSAHGFALLISLS